MAASHPIAPGVRFKDIDGFPGYCVGDDGSVWSRKGTGCKPGIYGEWRRLNPHPQSRGHCVVDLGRTNTRFVHRLVLETFVGPCPDGMECRHLDGNPLNNQIGNLAWGTRKENHDDSIDHGTAAWLRPETVERARHLWDHVEHKAGEKHHRARLSDDQVRIIRQTVDPAKLRWYRDEIGARMGRDVQGGPSDCEGIEAVFSPMTEHG